MWEAGVLRQRTKDRSIISPFKSRAQGPAPRGIARYRPGVEDIGLRGKVKLPAAAESQQSAIGSEAAGTGARPGQRSCGAGKGREGNRA